MTVLLREKINRNNYSNNQTVFVSAFNSLLRKREIENDSNTTTAIRLAVFDK